MSRPLRFLIALFIIAWPVLCARPATAEARLPYLQRLSLPSATDIFKWPYSVLDDVHTGDAFVRDQLNRRMVIFY